MTILKINPDGTTSPLGATATPPVNLQLVPNPKALSLKVTAQEFSAAGAVAGTSLGTVSSVVNLPTGAVPPADVGVTGLVLYDTDTMVDIRPLLPTDGIDLDKLTQHFSIRAAVSSNHTGIVSVVLTHDGYTNPENAEPYSLQGDKNPWVPTVGNHTVSAQAYSGTLGTGVKVGAAYTATIQVTKSVVPPPPPPPGGG